VIEVLSTGGVAHPCQYGWKTAGNRRPPLITAKATLAAGTACLMLTVTEESGNLWRYNLSEQKNSRLAYGKIIVAGHMAALRRAAEICADGYRPDSIERGLLDTFAQDAP
jgi:hypothetical protein